MKCDAMPLVYVRILVAGLRWSPKDKSNAGILYSRIWWAHRRVWNLSASGSREDKSASGGPTGSGTCRHLVGRPFPPPVFQPIRPLARLAPMPFPRPPALAVAGFFFHGIFFLRIFLPTAFFSALAKPAPIPIYFFLPGKKIALTKIVMVQGFEH